jgi:hypothetical protein
MITVTDPAGTPTVVYNRDGTTIANIIPIAGPSAPAPIIRHSGWTVVLAHSTVGNYGISLPADAEIGDLVEVIYDPPDNTVAIYADSGSTLDGNDSSTALILKRGLFRKVAASTWFSISLIT